MRSGGKLEPLQGSQRAILGWILFSLAAALLIGEILWYGLSTRFFGTGIYFLLDLGNRPISDYLQEYVISNSYYPPLYYLFLLGGYLLFGLKFLPLLLASSLFFIGGTAYVFLLGRRLSVAWIAGAAALVFVLLPGNAIYSKNMVFEVPLALLVPAFLYFLVRSEGLTRRGQALALGAVIGLGTLTKWTFIGYVAGPLALALIRPSWIGGTEAASGWRRPINLALAFAMAALLAAPWYLHSFDPEIFARTAENDPIFFSYDYLRHLQYNATQLLMLSGRATMAVLAMILVAGMALGRRPVPILILAVACFAVPLAVFSIPVHLEDRYLLPVLAFVPYLFVIAVSGTKSRAFAVLSSLAILVAAGWNHLSAVLPPGDAGYSTQEQILYVNHVHGRLFWGKARSAEILGLIQDIHYKDGGVDQQRPAVVTHPLWRSYHCAPNYFRYVQLIDPGFEDLRIVRYSESQYADFHDLLRKGDADFVLIDCGPTGKCEDRIPELYTKHYKIILEKVYVDQFTGVRSRPSNKKDVIDDLEFIASNYVLAESVPTPEGKFVNIFARRRTSEP